MLPNDPRLLTIVLNWRTPDMTLRAAEAALGEMEGIAGEVLIVDNDSQDGSYETMSRSVAERGWQRVRVIRSDRNGGFGYGNNVGIRDGMSQKQKPDYIYLLNSDAFPDPGAIRALVDHLTNHPSTGLAGSYIHGPEGDPHLTIFRFPSLASEFEASARIGPISRLLRLQAMPMPIPEQTCQVDWLAGASLMMRREVLEEIGLFDETFFLYFEETDLCRRANIAGYPTDFVKESAITHIGSASTGMKRWTRVPEYWFDSRRHYFQKSHGAAYARLATLAHIAGGLLHRLRCALTGRKPADPPHFLRSLIAHEFKPTPSGASPGRDNAPRMTGV